MATFAPIYPPFLYATILKYHHGPRNVCVDVGCGHGVVSQGFSPHFTKVIGTDPSLGMIKQAQSIAASDPQFPKNIRFREAKAEDLPFLEDESVDLVVAGQAAHWFDYPALFPELKRILRKGGALAFIGYKDCVFIGHPKASDILTSFAYDEHPDKMGPYWQRPGRTIVQNKLRDIEPPEADFEEITRIEYEPAPEKGPGAGEGTMFLSKKMTVENCANYVRTFSAFHGWQEAHPDQKRASEGGSGDLVDEMFEEMRKVEPEWSDKSTWNKTEVEVEWGSGLLIARKK
ncbi:hypothetical protein MMC25_001890 [Agyrium rufum]|nr:hypothetical protein [Agyrium rufum]